jgi:hypothetical protein
MVNVNYYKDIKLANLLSNLDVDFKYCLLCAA